MHDSTSNKQLPRLFAQALNEKLDELFDEFIHHEYNNHNAYVEPGAAVQHRSIDIWRGKDGKFIEHWDELNLLEEFPRIGAAALRRQERQ